jgi:phosphopantothenoylcysteine synthetase/decarboxylase
MKVLLGVTGGIAAFRACEVALLLARAGHTVRVVMTEGAQQFITPLTFETLTRQPVATRLWAPPAQHNVEHIELAQWPDVVAVAPATANIIGKIAHGIADDMLTTVVMASLPATPVVIAPAMNTKMWENPIVQRNVDLLRSLDGRYRFVSPRESLLACGDYGVGALAAPADIVAEIVAAYQTTGVQAFRRSG